MEPQKPYSKTMMALFCKLSPPLLFHITTSSNSPTLHFPLPDYKANINTNTSPQIMETKPPAAAGRRDEWSEGAVACLLDAYESKWELRSRAKLKGRDWDDVARRVSGRAGAARPAKTPSQCKNKIESMKKRYRSESAAAAAGGGGFSRWPFFGRIQRLMTWKNDSGGVLVLEGSPPAAAAAVPIGGAAEMNGEEPLEGKGENNESSQAQMDAKHNKPTNDTYKEREDREKNNKMNNNNNNKKKKKKKIKKKRKLQEEEEDGFEIIESIQSLVGNALKIEHLRMETMRDVEKIWAQAEAKKGEIDLKRTEIIAKTQLKIARLIYKSTV